MVLNIFYIIFVIQRRLYVPVQLQVLVWKKPLLIFFLLNDH